eukprot:353914-Chlamydomonas_euryale.AAC.3
MERGQLRVAPLSPCHAAANPGSPFAPPPSRPRPPHTFHTHLLSGLGCQHLSTRSMYGGGTSAGMAGRRCLNTIRCPMTTAGTPAYGTVLETSSQSVSPNE